MIKAIILGAGKGTRMKTSLPKVMHKVGGKTLVSHVLTAVSALKDVQPLVVVGSNMPELEQEISPHPFVEQTQQLGTAHGVLSAAEHIKDFKGTLLVLFADTPLIRPETLRQMVDTLHKEQAAVVVLSFSPEDAAEYGRVVLYGPNDVDSIVEYKDATPEQRKITLCNSGVMALDGKYAYDLLYQITNENAKGEYYLTDVVALARKAGLKCVHVTGSCEEVLGINTKADLAQVEKILQQRWRTHMMEQGVTLIDPESIYFSFDTQIAPGVIIEPHVFFGPRVQVSAGVQIKAFSHIEGAHIGANCVVGPFARLRPGSKLDTNVKVGNFVEIKASHLKSDAKVSHLSYIGDSDIGSNANVGAGVITCNYDGYKKHKTIIGKDAFIGSNSALVAPVVIGEGAIIGAGSTITKDVQAHDIVLERTEQQIITDGAVKYHQKRK